MNALAGLLSSFRKGSARRSAARSLASLTAAELADLGMTPDRIDDVVDEMLLRNEHAMLRAAAPSFRGERVRSVAPGYALRRS
jgi:hypothetical protein